MPLFSVTSIYNLFTFLFLYWLLLLAQFVSIPILIYMVLLSSLSSLFSLYLCLSVCVKIIIIIIIIIIIVIYLYSTIQILCSMPFTKKCVSFSLCINSLPPLWSLKTSPKNNGYTEVKHLLKYLVGTEDPSPLCSLSRANVSCSSPPPQTHIYLPIASLS